MTFCFTNLLFTMHSDVNLCQPHCKALCIRMTTCHVPDARYIRHRAASNPIHTTSGSFVVRSRNRRKLRLTFGNWGRYMRTSGGTDQLWRESVASSLSLCHNMTSRHRIKHRALTDRRRVCLLTCESGFQTMSRSIKAGSSMKKCPVV